jgi:hypothetical protein
MARVNKTSVLIPPKSPNLPIATTEYQAQYQDQLNSIQRLYYNTIDSSFSSLLGPNGGQFLNINRPVRNGN